MKCPRCGSELSSDSHRKYAVQMCYNCGYMEGRYFGADAKKGFTNFEHMKTLNVNELTVFLADGIGVDQEKVSAWLCDVHKN